MTVRANLPLVGAREVNTLLSLLEKHGKDNVVLADLHDRLKLLISKDKK